MPQSLCSKGIHLYNPDQYDSCPYCEPPDAPRGAPHNTVGGKAHAVAHTVVVSRPEGAPPPDQAPQPAARPNAPDAGDATILFSGALGGPDTAGHKPVAGWLVIVEGPGTGMDFRLTPGNNKIGRSRDMDVCLDTGPHKDRKISRFHALIIHDANTGRFYLERGESDNIPTLNGVSLMELDRTHKLAAGDILQLGDTRLELVPFRKENHVP